MTNLQTNKTKFTGSPTAAHMCRRRMGVLVMLSASGMMACQESQEIVITLGPTGTVRATGIQPSCEQITPRGEFSADFYAVLYDETTHGAKSDLTTEAIDMATTTTLPRLSRATLAEGGTIELATSATFRALEGREVCVFSQGAEEHDQLVNDRLSNSRDCHTLSASAKTHTFTLTMSTGECRLTYELESTSAVVDSQTTSSDGGVTADAGQ